MTISWRSSGRWKREDRQIRVLHEEDQLRDKILEQLAEERGGSPADSAGRINLVRVLREFLQTAFR